MYQKYGDRAFIATHLHCQDNQYDQLLYIQGGYYSVVGPYVLTSVV